MHSNVFGALGQWAGWPHHQHRRRQFPVSFLTPSTADRTLALFSPLGSLRIASAAFFPLHSTPSPSCHLGPVSRPLFGIRLADHGLAPRLAHNLLRLEDYLEPRRTHQQRHRAPRRRRRQQRERQAHPQPQPAACSAAWQLPPRARRPRARACLGTSTNRRPPLVEAVSSAAVQPPGHSRKHRQLEEDCLDRQPPRRRRLLLPVLVAAFLARQIKLLLPQQAAAVSLANRLRLRILLPAAGVASSANHKQNLHREVYCTFFEV